MYYYKKIENGEVVSLVSASIPNASEELTEISEDEFNNLFPKSEPLTLDGLAKENKKLKTQIELQSEQLTFLEDCILEMADEVYA